jgi:hypothetical protein
MAQDVFPCSCAASSWFHRTKRRTIVTNILNMDAKPNSVKSCTNLMDNDITQCKGGHLPTFKPSTFECTAFELCQTAQWIQDCFLSNPCLIYIHHHITIPFDIPSISQSLTHTSLVSSPFRTLGPSGDAFVCPRWVSTVLQPTPLRWTGGNNSLWLQHLLARN